MTAAGRVTLDELVDVLLELSGGWFVLAEALELVRAAERISPAPDGAAWAQRVIATIERVRDGGTNTTAPRG